MYISFITHLTKCAYVLSVDFNIKRNVRYVTLKNEGIGHCRFCLRDQHIVVTVTV